MNSYLGKEEHEPNQVFERVSGFLEDGFKEVDMQFNIGRLEGQEQWGYDLVKKNEGRFLVTGPSDEFSGAILEKAFGKHAVLEPIEQTEDYTVFPIPSGARLLVKTLQNPPYEAPYLRLLTSRANLLLDRLEKLEPSRFSIRPERIAIGHNGEESENQEDDTFLMLVPPYSSPYVQETDEPSQEYVYSPKELDAIASSLGRFATNHIANAAQLSESYASLLKTDRNDLWKWLKERHL